jgi:hypothetical protein
MAEQIIGGPEPDVVALKLFDNPLDVSDAESADRLSGRSGSIALAEPANKPTTSLMMVADEDRYLMKTNRVVVRKRKSTVMVKLAFFDMRVRSARLPYGSFFGSRCPMA